MELQPKKVALSFMWFTDSKKNKAPGDERPFHIVATNFLSSPSSTVLHKMTNAIRSLIAIIQTQDDLNRGREPLM